MIERRGIAVAGIRDGDFSCRDDRECRSEGETNAGNLRVSIPIWNPQMAVAYAGLALNWVTPAFIAIHGEEFTRSSSVGLL